VHLDHPEYHQDSIAPIWSWMSGPADCPGTRHGREAFAVSIPSRPANEELSPYFPKGRRSRLVEEGRRNLIDFFQSKGYFDVKVTPIPNQVSHVSWSTTSTEARATVESRQFPGNQHSIATAIRQVAVKPHRLVLLSRGKFSDKLLRQSVAGITAFYKNWI